MASCGPRDRSRPASILCTVRLVVVADYNLARTFVTEHAGPLEVARIDAAIGYPDPPACTPAASRELDSLELAGGGVPAPWSAGQPGIEATAGHLGVLDELKVTDERAMPVAQFLAHSQREDGSFAESDAGGRSMPGWLLPTDPDALVYLTAYVAHRLGAHGQHGDAVYRAVDYLAPHVGNGHVGYLSALWFTASAYAALGDLSSAETLLAGVAPEVEDLGPTALASLASTVGWSSVANGARFRLMWRQEPDGRWASEVGEHADVATTIDATRALVIGDHLEPG